MKRIIKNQVLLILLTLISVFEFTFCDISVSTHDLTIELDRNDFFDLHLSNVKITTKLTFIVQHVDIIQVEPSHILLNPNRTNETYRINVQANGAGHSEILANSSDPDLQLGEVFVRVTVYKSHGWDVFSIVIGWSYFVAWSLTFYTQMYLNFKRKSVVGLHFEFITLNLIGFIMYSLFNLGLYFIPEIKMEYSNRYPRGLNPVKINDIFFAVHAVASTLIIIIQCFIYERGDQKVSITARSIVSTFAVVLLISIILAATNVFHWLDFLYICSYIKLTTTLIKYAPQAYLNYKRKSTVGWNITNSFLDLTGGILSMLQMIVNAYNYNDWISIFGDPTKFGLGLFSVVFDIFFIIQRYVFYRHTDNK